LPGAPVETLETGNSRETAVFLGGLVKDDVRPPLAPPRTMEDAVVPAPGRTALPVACAPGACAALPVSLPFGGPDRLGLRRTGPRDWSR